mgnify:CR=1 FL=1
MSDLLLRALARDAGIQISAARTTGLVERPRQIHSATPLATAALGRTLTATAIMGSQLKTPDGSVTVQVKGNGPLGAIVCVGDADGYVRGYLQDPSADLPLRADGKLDVGGGVGRGYLMVIKDIGLKDPVTGTVALVNGEIAEDLTRYFAESEQIPSACALGVLVDTDLSVRCAGGFIVQLLPGATEQEIDMLERNIKAMPSVTAMLEQGKTVRDMLDMALQGFQPDILDSYHVTYRCDCSRERVETMLRSLGRSEVEKLRDEDPVAEVDCQFCDKVYRVDLAELLKNWPASDEKIEEKKN